MITIYKSAYDLVGYLAGNKAEKDSVQVSQLYTSIEYAIRKFRSGRYVE